MCRALVASRARADVLSLRVKPTILETTLRDGSYVLNFQFTASDTAILCGELERAGFSLIEVGHGIGLGASDAGLGTAAETDEAYLRAAAESIKRPRWGTFCIPGIAKVEDVEMAAQFGMRFIRIGTNVTDVEQSEPFIACAKRHGMFVCANFMKSYATAPKEFAAKARLSPEVRRRRRCTSWTRPAGCRPRDGGLLQGRPGRV